MALTYDQWETVSKPIFDGNIKQDVYDECVFFAKLRKEGKETYDGGSELTWTTRHKKLGTGGSVGWDDQAVFEAKDTRTRAKDDWAPYRATTLLTWKEHALNKGEGAIVKLLEDKRDEVVEELKDNLYTDLFATSAVAGKITPLAVLVDSAVSYAGIAVADAAEWKSVEDNTTDLALTRLMLNTKRAAATFGRNAPNLHITTRTLVGKYDSLLGENERYEDVMTANMGFENVTFHHKPVVGDAFVPTGYWYGLDMSCIELAVVEDEDMHVEPWFDAKSLGYPRAMAKYVSTVLQIMGRRRKTHFKLTSVSSAA